MKGRPKAGSPKVVGKCAGSSENNCLPFPISSSLNCGFCILNKHSKFNYHSPSISQFKSTFSTPITHKFYHWCPDLIRRNLFPHFSLASPNWLVNMWVPCLPHCLCLVFHLGRNSILDLWHIQTILVTLEIWSLIWLIFNMAQKGEK